METSRQGRKGTQRGDSPSAILCDLCVMLVSNAGCVESVPNVAEVVFEAEDFF